MGKGMGRSSAGRDIIVATNGFDDTAAEMRLLLTVAFQTHRRWR